VSSEKKASRPVSRRAVVGAAVWATPVVAVVSATPAHAVGSPKKTITDARTFVRELSAGGGSSSGTLYIWDVQIAYDGGWSGIDYDKKPTIATVSWRVYALDSNGNHVGEFDSASNQAITMYGHVTATGQISNLPAGTYTVIAEITSVSYSPNPINDVMFVTIPSTRTVTAAVRTW